MPDLVSVQSEKDIENIRELFKEYAESLGFDLAFQHFKEEFNELPSQYAPPDGCILLAKDKEKIAGCVALRKMDENICEMKRLYVRKAFRGKGIGKELSIVIIQKAREMGYKSMRLDTVPSMKQAIALYRSLGFKEIEPYRYNPIEGATFMELEIDNKC
ncbi:MAG: GNAT family N-acetyltransferase [Candidatus Zixiibacteriota bacterium]